MLARKIYLYAFFILMSFCLLFVGCSQDVMKECQNKISDERVSYFEGETENYYVSFSSGMRESPYLLNGKSEEKVEFGVVTIKPKGEFKTEKLTYSVCSDNDEYSGEFEQSPFDDSYAGDINKKIDDNSVLVIKINNGSGEEIAEMENITSTFKVNSQKALKIALDELGERYNKLRENDFEIHIKIVSDITNKVEEKYYLVSFLGADGKSINIIVNPKTGECEIKNI